MTAGLSVETLCSLGIDTPRRLMVVAINRLGNVINAPGLRRPVLPVNDATQRISCKYQSHHRNHRCRHRSSGGRLCAVWQRRQNQVAILVNVL